MFLIIKNAKIKNKNKIISFYGKFLIQKNYNLLYLKFHDLKQYYVKLILQ